MARKEYSAAERAEYRERKRNESRERLETAARELLSSDGWRRWAETRATFHDYSFGNCMLIAMQCPHASQVAGFHKWRELERQVRKGEKGISILAPMVVGGSKSDRSAVRKGELTAAASEGLETDGGPRVAFRSVYVFDVSQTEGEPLPEPPREPIDGDSHAGYLPALERHARELGLEVERRELEGAGGFYSESAKVIALASGRPANADVRTLVHELAHAHGVTYKDYSRDDAECIVETAAFIVCGSIGLDTSGESVPYVAGWGEDDQVGAVRKFAAKVDELARTLESVVLA